MSKKKRAMTLSQKLRAWDEDRFSLDDALGAETPRGRNGDTFEGEDKKRINALSLRLERFEEKTVLKLYPFMAALLAVIITAFLMMAVAQMPPYGAADTPANTSVVIERYLGKGLEETGAVNLVAGVILDYRAFDTLGESHVLFTATVAVMTLLLGAIRPEPGEEETILTGDLILRTTAKMMTVFIVLFGIYIVLFGHLGPGGGFSGGAVIGGGLILCSLAFGPDKLAGLLTLKRFRVIVLCALVFYSVSKCYSFFCGANGLETVFTTGTPGSIFSAGLILPLNIAVGTVVACTMYGFYSIFTRGKI